MTIQQVTPPNNTDTSIRYFKLEIQKAQIYMHEPGAPERVETITPLLQRGFYYFAQNSQGHVIKNCYSAADTAKMVLLKHRTALAFHHSLPEAPTLLQQKSVHYSVPEVTCLHSELPASTLSTEFCCRSIATEPMCTVIMPLPLIKAPSHFDNE